MWNGKNRAVTFSFDDGCQQDKSLIKIFNEYGLKCTFNLNSGFLGTKGTLQRNGRTVPFDKVKASEITDVYDGHEIAVHTLTHPGLCDLDEETIIRQVEEDRKALESLCGYRIAGMAYPGGGNDDRVAKIIEKNTPIKYARTVTSTYGFYRQDNLMRFNPTVHFIETDKLFGLCDAFLNSEDENPRLFYIWGHAFETDAGYNFS